MCETKAVMHSGLVPMPEDFEDISLDSEQDYDRDGLSDVTEINFDVTGEDGNALITVNDDGSIVLPNFNECVAASGTYVENGLQRFYDEADDYILGFLDIIKVLPLMSDPTSEDGDGDGVLDSVEYSIIQEYSRNAVTYSASDDESEEADVCFLDLLSSNSIMEYGFNTGNKITGTLLNKGKIKKSYTLGYEHEIKAKAKGKNYGFKGYDTDVFYLEAYCEYGEDHKVLSNELRINANIYCPEESIILCDDSGATTSDSVSKDKIFEAICSKWGNGNEVFQGSKDDFFGMKVNVSVNINEVLSNSESSDGTETVKNKPNKRAVSCSGELENYKGKYATLNLIGSNPKKDKSRTKNGLTSFPEIFLYNTSLTTSGDIKYNNEERVLATAVHEFGHILGLMDAYGFSNEYNYYMEPVSNNEIIYDAGKYGDEAAGEIMHSNGKVCANDIEMAIYARKTDEYQFFVPIGYSITTETNKDGTTTNVRNEWGLSPAIRADYEYRSKRTWTNTYICSEDEGKLEKDKIYVFDPAIKKYRLKK